MCNLKQLSLLALVSVQVACSGGETAEIAKCTQHTDCGLHAFCSGGTCLTDEVKPSLTILTPTADALLGTATVRLSGNVSDGEGSGIARIEWSADGSTFAGVEYDSSGAFSIDIALEGSDFRPVSLTVRAIDVASNEISEAVSFALDTTGPAIEVISPAKSVFGTADVGQSITFEARVADGDRVASLEVSTDGGTTWTPVADPSRGVLIPSFFEVEAGIPSSTKTIAIRATDRAGNSSPSTHTFFIDTVPPILTMNLENDQVLGKTAPNPFSIQTQVEEPNLASARYSLDEGTPIEAPVINGAIAYALGLSDSEDFAPHIFTVEATDTAGNTTELRAAFFVDRVAPRVTIANPASDAIVNIATGPAFPLSGRIEDGSPHEDLSATATISDLPVFLSFGATGQWTARWTDIPTVDGEDFTFEISVCDLGGNCSTQTRILHLDRVAPRIVASVHGERLVARDAPLVRFSEPMNVASVKSAALVNGASPAASFGSTDDFQFGFMDENSLEPYSKYNLEIGNGAQDAAGNGFAEYAQIVFLTEPREPPRGGGMAIATEAGSPMLATDPDGKVSLLWSTTTGFAMASWNGADRWENETIDYTPTAVQMGALRSSFSFTTTEPLIPSVTHRFAFLSSMNLTARAVVASRSDGPWTFSSLGTANWTGRPTLQSGMSPACQPSTTCDYVAFISQSGTSIVASALSASGWTTPTTLMALSQAATAMSGAGATDDTVAFVPAGLDLGYSVSVADGVVIAGADRALGAGGSEVNSAWLLWADQYSIAGGLPSLRLQIACSSLPASAGSWRSAPVTAPFAASWPSVRVTDAVLAVSEALVAVGIADSEGRVFFGSLPNGLCESTPPEVTWRPAIVNARQPAVAIGRNAVVYRAYVKTTTDSLLWDP